MSLSLLHKGASCVGSNKMFWLFHLIKSRNQRGGLFELVFSQDVVTRHQAMSPC